MAKRREYDLEDRLIRFAVRVIKVAESLPKTETGIHIRRQLLRSGTSPAPNHGEAQSAESPADFVHKIKIVLKELRESRVWLLMVRKAGLIKPAARLAPVIQECNELIAIFVTSVHTARKNGKRTGK